MKILLLTNKPPWPPHDGGAQATLNMIQGLSYFGAQLTVLYMNTLKHHTQIDEIPENYRKMASFYSVNINTGIKAFDITKNLFFSREPYNLKRFESDTFNNKLKELFNNEYDIVQLEGISLYFYLDTIRAFSKSTVVLRAHNIENKIWSGISSSERNLLKKIYYRIISGRLLKLEKSIIVKFDALVTISHIDLEWFRNIGIRIPSISVPAGIDFSIPAVPVRKGEKRIGFLGSLDWTPNILGLKWFIKNVWPVVSQRSPETTLHIAGRNGNKNLPALFSGRNIIYYGEVENSTDFIDDKTIMITPIFAGSGIKIKVMEAMSRGKVVIATTGAVEGIDICPGKNILIADSIKEYSENLFNALNDELLRINIGNEAFKVVHDKYDIFVITNDLVKFYSTLIT